MTKRNALPTQPPRRTPPGRPATPPPVEPAFVPPYPPSAFDRFTAWVDRLPIPPGWPMP
jgi:hypothetical protein